MLDYQKIEMMEKVKVILKGGPMNGEQVEVEKGRPFIEVAALPEHSDTFLKIRNCTPAPAMKYKRSLYVLSNKSDLEYLFSEQKM